MLKGAKAARYLGPEIVILDNFLTVKKEAKIFNKELNDLVSRLANAREDQHKRSADAIQTALLRRRRSILRGVLVQKKSINSEKIIGTIIEACNKLKEAMGTLMERCRELEKENERLVADRDECREHLKRLTKVRAAVEEYQESYFPKPKVQPRMH